WQLFAIRSLHEAPGFDVCSLRAHGVASTSSAIASSITVARGSGDSTGADLFSLGRSIETPAPSTETAARIQRAVCMLVMNGSSWALERPEARPEKILKRTLVGTAAVMIARTKAIERIAPVFCSIVRAPAAIPRPSVGTVPIIAAVLGELNIPEPIPTRKRKRPPAQ